MTDQVHLARRSMADKEVYLGIDLGARRPLLHALGGLTARASDREVAALTKPIRATDEIAALPGLDGTPATPRELEWLLHRSCSLGLPAPVTLGAAELPDWDDGDLDEFTDHVTWTAIPYGRTITVRGETDAGAVIERHVCVLSVGRMTDLEIPPGMPVDPAHRPAPVPGRVVRPGQPSRTPARSGRRCAATSRRSAPRRTTTRSSTTNPPPAPWTARPPRPSPSRTRSPCGLSGLSPPGPAAGTGSPSPATPRTQALERASAVRKIFAPQVTITRPADQYAVAREFIPGERLGSTAYKRRMPVTTLAAAVPTATAKVGDRVGIHLGETSGTSARVVTWEPWLATEQAEESGLAVICAGLGGGKSTAGGNIIYRTVMQGVGWTVLDPSGRLTALCRLPQLEAVSQAVDLLDAPPGALCTYRVIAEPRREHYTTDGRVAGRAGQRRRHPPAADRQRPARHPAPADAGARPHRGRPDAGRRRRPAHHHLQPAATSSPPSAASTETPSCAATPATCTTSSPRPPTPATAGSSSPPGTSTTTAPATPLLTVYSLRGLTFPDEHAKGSEDLDERLSMCVLYVAAWLAQRGMYLGDIHARKGIFIDEAWALSTFTTGRRFIERAGRDSRKHNTRVLMASQNPSDLLKLDLANLVSAAFIGRLTGEDAQRDALRFLPGIATRPGLRGHLRVPLPALVDRTPRRPGVRLQRRRRRRRTDPDGPLRPPRPARRPQHHRRPDQDPHRPRHRLHPAADAARGRRHSERAPDMPGRRRVAQRPRSPHRAARHRCRPRRSGTSHPAACRAARASPAYPTASPRPPRNGPAPACPARSTPPRTRSLPRGTRSRRTPPRASTTSTGTPA